jgi:subtilase family serine protease
VIYLKNASCYLTASASAVVKPLLSFLFLIDSAMARANENNNQVRANLRCNSSCTEVSILLVTFIAELSITLNTDISEATEILVCLR